MSTLKNMLRSGGRHILLGDGFYRTPPKPLKPEYEEVNPRNLVTEYLLKTRAEATGNKTLDRFLKLGR